MSDGPSDDYKKLFQRLDAFLTKHESRSTAGRKGGSVKRTKASGSAAVSTPAGEAKVEAMVEPKAESKTEVKTEAKVEAKEPSFWDSLGL